LSPMSKLFKPAAIFFGLCIPLSCVIKERRIIVEDEGGTFEIIEEYTDSDDYQFGDEEAVDSILTQLNLDVESDSGNYDTYLRRAYHYDNKGNYLKALEDYTKAISLNPKKKTIYIDRAILKSNNFRTEEALRDYQEILELWPNDPDAFNNIGGIVMSLANFGQNDALSFLRTHFGFKESIQLDPRDYINAGMNEPLYRAIELKAIEYFEKAIKYNPKHRMAYGNKALALYYLRETEEACRFWNIAKQFDDPNAEEYIKNICKELKK
jgi:tetratricopeptide (TPR) repeat protein